MSAIVWLKDGRKCKWISGDKETGFIVEPYAVYFDYVGDDANEEKEFEELSGRLEKADKIYGAPPVDVIDAECRTILESGAKIQKKYDDLMKDYALLTRSYEQMKAYKTDLSRYIINREELKMAKRLILWPESKIEPRIMDGKNGAHKFNLSYEISQYPEQEKVWCYKGYTEQKYHEQSYSTYSEYFDPAYGIKCDLTDNEILAITHERQVKKKFDEHAILSTPDEWLTPENIERKKAYKEASDKYAIEAAEKAVKDAELKLNILKSKQVVS